MELQWTRGDVFVEEKHLVEESQEVFEGDVGVESRL